MATPQATGHNALKGLPVPHSQFLEGLGQRLRLGKIAKSAPLLIAHISAGLTFGDHSVILTYLAGFLQG